MKTKFIIYLFGAVLFITLLSCNTSRKSQNSQVSKSKLNVVEQHDFEENYYSGIKSKLIDNDVNKAIEYFEKCVSIDNQNAGVLYELAKLYMQLKKYPQSQELLEKATQVDPRNKWYLMTLVENYSLQSNYEKAISTLRKLADIEPYNIQIYLKLSDLFWLDKQPAKAIKVLDNIEQMSGVLPEVSDRKRSIYMSMGKSDEAINEMQKLCNAFPDNPDYIKALIDMYVMYEKTENILPLYQKILSIDSNDGRAQMVMSDFYRNTGQSEQALVYTQKVIKNPELDVNNKINYLMITYAKGKITTESKQLLLHYTDLLLEVHPLNAQVLAFKGDIYFNTEQTDSALSAYLLSMDQEKSNYLVWKKVIMLYFDQKNYVKASEKCAQARDYFPTNPEIYFYEGIALMQMKKNSEAAEILESGVSYVINNKPLQQQFYANLGEVYNSLNIYEKSDKYYEKSLEIDPNDGFVLNNYAYFLSLRKVRLDDAKRMSEKSLTFDPENPANLDTYGWILFLMKDYTSAEKQIAKALTIKPDDSDILEHYGDILFLLEQRDRAVEYWIKAKSNGSTSATIDRKIRDKKIYE